MTPPAGEGIAVVYWTVRFNVAETFSTVTPTVAVPGLTPVMSPNPSVVITLGSLTLQWSTRPVRTLP